MPTVNNLGMSMPAPPNVSPIPMAAVKPKDIKGQPAVNNKPPKLPTPKLSNPLTTSSKPSLASYKTAEDWLDYMNKLAQQPHFVYDDATRRRMAELKLINKNREGGIRDAMSALNPFSRYDAKKQRARELTKLKTQGINIDRLRQEVMGGKTLDQALAGMNFDDELKRQAKSVYNRKFSPNRLRSSRQAGWANNLSMLAQELEGTPAGKNLNELADFVRGMSQTTKFRGGGSQSGRFGALKEHGMDAIRHMTNPKVLPPTFYGGGGSAPFNIGKWGKLGLGAGALGLLGYGGAQAFNAMSQASPYGMGQLQSMRDPSYDLYQGMPQGYGGY